MPARTLGLEMGRRVAVKQASVAQGVKHGSVTRSVNQAPAAQAEACADSAFHRAILKIALELKKPNAPSYEAIVSATIGSMRLDPEKFRRYLGENGAKNMSLMLGAARAMGH